MCCIDMPCCLLCAVCCVDALRTGVALLCCVLCAVLMRCVAVVLCSTVML